LNKSAASPGQAGFTILELLIAAALTAVILSSVYWSFSTVVGSSRRYRTGSDAYQAARVVLGGLERELSGIYVPFYAGEDEDDVKNLFLTDDLWAGGFESDRISFITTTFLRSGREDTPGYDTWEISYYREEDKLMAKVAPCYSLDEPFEGGEEMILAEGVRSLDFKYYSPEEEAWQDEWDILEEEALPTAVKVTVGFGPSDEEEDVRRFSVAAWVPAGGSKAPPEEDR